MNNVNIGLLLQACRERAGYNQSAMADLLVRDQSCISRIERNRKKPDFDTVMQWIEATDSKDVLIAYLYGLEGMTILFTLKTPMGVA